MAGYCWIGLLNPDCNPVWWIGLSIQFLHFNPNPKAIIFLIKKLKTHGQSCSSKKAKLFLITICLAFKKLVDKNMPLGNSMFKTLMQNTFNVCCLFFSSSWNVIGFGLDFQSILKSGFGFGFSIIFLCWIWIGLTIQKIGLSKSLSSGECRGLTV